MLTLITEKEINIYVGLTEMQRKWYRSVLEKDIDAVNGKAPISVLPTTPYVWRRFDRQERGQDTLDEHGYAGMVD
jgi:hypothetical protein